MVICIIKDDKDRFPYMTSIDEPSIDKLLESKDSEQIYKALNRLYKEFYIKDTNLINYWVRNDN